MCRTNTEWEKVEEDMRRFYEDSFVLDREGVDRDLTGEVLTRNVMRKMMYRHYTFLVGISERAVEWRSLIVLLQAFEICALTKTGPIWDSKRNSHLCKLVGLSVGRRPFKVDGSRWQDWIWQDWLFVDKTEFGKIDYSWMFLIKRREIKLCERCSHNLIYLI